MLTSEMYRYLDSETLFKKFRGSRKIFLIPCKKLLSILSQSPKNPRSRKKRMQMKTRSNKNNSKRSMKKREKLELRAKITKYLMMQQEQ
jgi:hypothetical protein